MRISSTRFVPTAAVLAAAMLFGAPSFAQTGGASNAIPNAGAKQNPQATNPVIDKVSKEEKKAASAKRKAERAAKGPSSSNPLNPQSNATGNAATNVETSATPTSKK